MSALPDRPAPAAPPELPADHPERARLAAEVHARPSEALAVPARASCVAVLVEPQQRTTELERLAALCSAFGEAGPDADARHFRADLGAVRLRWERHGEFSSYTVFAAGAGPAPFAQPPAAWLPPGWLAGVPGRTVFAAHAELVDGGAGLPDGTALAAYFGPSIVIGAEVGGGAGAAYTDFRLHADGCARFLLVDRGFTPRQAGRMLQRLFEIETYRVLALLALPIAREQAPRIGATETALARLTGEIGRDAADDEALLHEITRLAGEVESGLAATQFRFGACRAYHDLVATRIGELREGRIPGLQTIAEFMQRRFAPAVATCASTAQRLQQLSDRVGQASALLSTRVGIARERQNQALLESMNRRARQQLRLQQAVEGLSVVAIVYYASGLVGTLAKAAKAWGWPVNPELAAGIAVPAAALVTLWAMRRAHRRVFKD